MKDNLDLEKIVAELEQKRGPAEPSHRPAKGTQLPRQCAEDRCWERPGLRSATWPASYRGWQKAIVGADEETLGREKT
jgi:hypothetical protein